MNFSSPDLHKKAPANLVKNALDILPSTATLPEVIFMVNCLIGYLKPELLTDPDHQAAFGQTISENLAEMYASLTAQNS